MRNRQMIRNAAKRKSNEQLMYGTIVQLFESGKDNKKGYGKVKEELEDQVPHIIIHLTKLWLYPSYDRRDWYNHIAAAPRKSPRYRSGGKSSSSKVMSSDKIKEIMYNYSLSSDVVLKGWMDQGVSEVDKLGDPRYDYDHPWILNKFKKMLDTFYENYSKKLREKTSEPKGINGEDIEGIINELKQEGSWDIEF